MTADGEEEVPPKERIIVTALKSKVSVHGVYEAALIGDIFQFQRTGATNTLPIWTEISSTFG